MVIDCGNALRWSRVSHKLRAIFSFHCMMLATLTFTEKQQPGAVLTIHKLKLRLESFQPRNTSTRVYSHFHSHIISSDLVDNNAVSFNSQLNGLLTTLGTVYPSLNWLTPLGLTAVSSLGWYHTKQHNIGCKFRQKTKGLR